MLVENSNNVIIINSKPPPVLEPTLTDMSALLTCPYCTSCVTTKTYPQNGAFTFLAIGCFATCCLCCIPLICTRFKDIKHECPTCTSEVGVFRRIGQ